MDINELEACVSNRLQEKKRGQTVQELAQHCRAAESEILTVLHKRIREYVEVKGGVWKMKRNGVNSAEN
jgi:hypothetical protein